MISHEATIESRQPIAEPAEPSTIVAAKKEVLVRGRVLDVEGESVRGCEIGAGNSSGFPWMIEGAVLTQSGADGTFGFSPKLPVTLVAAMPGLRTLIAARVDGSSPEGVNIVVGRVLSVGGVVLQRSGGVLSGARIEYVVTSDSLVALPNIVTANFVWPYAACTSDAQGRFTLSELIHAPASRLRVSMPGFEVADIEMPATTTDSLEVMLKPLDRGGVIHGLVIDDARVPVPSALIRFGSNALHSSPEGTFELPMSAATSPGVQVVVTKSGFQPLVVQDVQKSLVNSRGGTLELQLAGPSLSISGRVLGDSGEPLAGWVVGILNPSPLMSAYPGVGWIEGDGTTTTPTDDLGAFSIGMLLSRDYTLVASDPRTLVNVRSGPIRAGTKGVELHVPADTLFASIAGRVLSMDGQALAGVSVAALYVTRGDDVATDPAVWLSASTWSTGQSTLTNSDGKFQLNAVPRSGLKLLCSGDSVIPSRITPPEGFDPEQLNLIVARRRSIRVDATSSWKPGLSFEVLDASGQRLQLYSISTNQWETMEQYSPVGPVTPILSVSEGARTLRVSSPGGAKKEYDIVFNDDGLCAIGL